MDDDLPELDQLDGAEEPLFADDLDMMDDYDDPPPLPPPMPSLEELAQQRRANRNEDNNDPFDTLGMTPDDVGGAGGVVSDKAPPQKKRKPLLTLTIDRIFSEKGLPRLEKEFPKLKFKGKGHEASDLKYLMQQYEHWANALYPKLTFKDVTDRIEALAKKKEFKSQLIQMRRRHIRGGVTTPPLSDVDDPITDTSTQPVPTSNGLDTSNNDDENMIGSGIGSGDAPDDDELNLNIDHMVSDRQGTESSRGDATNSQFSNTALTRLTMDGLDSFSDEDEIYTS